MSDLELDGPCQFTGSWFRASLSHALHHISIYGYGKRHGFATLLFIVCSIVSFQYGYIEYLDNRSAYLMAIDKVDELSVNISCSAILCLFYQEEECEDQRRLTAGDNTSVAAVDCTWTVKVVTDSNFESKRTALGLLSQTENDTTKEYFAAVEQETLKFVSLSKTVDETYVPPFESWSVQVFSTYDYYSDCASYHDNYNVSCGAFQLSFDNKVYTITENDQVGFIIVISAGMLSTVVFWAIWKVIVYNFDAGSELHNWLNDHQE